VRPTPGVSFVLMAETLRYLCPEFTNMRHNSAYPNGLLR
jgi:hypothetical protein